MIAEARQVEIRLSRRQTAAWDLFHAPDVRSLLYGGAKGGGKSVFACLAFFDYAGQVIRDFGIEPSDDPVPIGFFGRKRGVDFKKTTLETWRRIIPGGCYRIKKAEQEIVIRDRVKIYYGGLDDESTVNKFNSAEFGMICIDQAEECTLDDVAVLRATLRLKIGDRKLPYKELWTANPAQCWLKDEFVGLGQWAPGEVHDGAVFVQALPSDNPFLADDYIETLKRTFKHRPELLEAYLNGSWDAFAAADQCIREQWIRAALARKIHWPAPRRFLVCDVARFGDDETVIYLFEETDIVKDKIFGQKDTMHTANILHIAAVQEGVDAVGVDDIGVGGGVVDRLNEMANGQYQVIPINSDAASPDDLHGNLRAYMWDLAAQELQAGDIALTHADPILIGQLCTPRYFFRSGKMWIEKKEDIKKRIGRSPDRGDTYVMGNYLRRFVTVRAASEKRRLRTSYLDRNRRAASAMAS